MAANIEQDLIALALATAGIAALVGERVHYLELPPDEPELPAVVLSRMPGSVYTPELDGGSSFVSGRFKFKVVAETALALIGLAQAVEALDGTTGELNGVGSTDATLLLDDEYDEPEQLGDGSGLVLPGRSVVFAVSFNH